MNGPLLLFVAALLGQVEQPPSPELPSEHPKVGNLPPGHPPIDAMAEDSMMQELDQAKDLLGKEKTFEVAQALGKLYYSQGRYPEAVTFFRQAMEKAASLRTFARKVEKGVSRAQSLPLAAEVGCAANGPGGWDALGKKAEEWAKKGSLPSAVACSQQAMRPVLEAELLLAYALFLTGSSDLALAELDAVLSASEQNDEAVFARGAVLLDSRGDQPKALGEAKRSFERYLTLSPTGPRAALAKKLLDRVEAAQAAGGVTALAAQRRVAPTSPPADVGAAAPLKPEVIEAFQNTERTPELEAGLGKLVEQAEAHLARAEFREALDAYTRVVPFQPQNGRAKAGMAWAMVGLNKQPMADRIWTVAVTSDPAAVEKLGDELKARGDAKGAKALWSKLLESAPEYSKKTGLGAKLR